MLDRIQLKEQIRSEDFNAEKVAQSLFDLNRNEQNEFDFIEIVKNLNDLEYQLNNQGFELMDDFYDVKNEVVKRILETHNSNPEQTKISNYYLYSDNEQELFLNTRQGVDYFSQGYIIFSDGKQRISLTVLPTVLESKGFDKEYNQFIHDLAIENKVDKLYDKFKSSDYDYIYDFCIDNLVGKDEEIKFLAKDFYNELSQEEFKKYIDENIEAEDMERFIQSISNNNIDKFISLYPQVLNNKNIVKTLFEMDYKKGEMFNHYFQTFGYDKDFYLDEEYSLTNFKNILKYLDVNLLTEQDIINAGHIEEVAHEWLETRIYKNLLSEERIKEIETKRPDLNIRHYISEYGERNKWEDTEYKELKEDVDKKRDEYKNVTKEEFNKIIKSGAYFISLDKAEYFATMHPEWFNQENSEKIVEKNEELVFAIPTQFISKSIFETACRNVVDGEHYGWKELEEKRPDLNRNEIYEHMFQEDPDINPYSFSEEFLKQSNVIEKFIDREDERIYKLALKTCPDLLIKKGRFYQAVDRCGWQNCSTDVIKDKNIFIENYIKWGQSFENKLRTTHPEYYNQENFNEIVDRHGLENSNIPYEFITKEMVEDKKTINNENILNYLIDEHKDWLNPVLLARINSENTGKTSELIEDSRQQKIDDKTTVLKSIKDGDVEIYLRATDKVKQDPDVQRAVELEICDYGETDKKIFLAEITRADLMKDKEQGKDITKDTGRDSGPTK